MSVAVLDGAGVDAEVADHCVRFPTADELDRGRVNVGAQEGGGPARAEAAGTEEERVNASEVAYAVGGVADGVCDVRGKYGARSLVWVVVCTDGGRRCCTVSEQASGEASEGLARTICGVLRGPMPDTFTPHGVLLVSEDEGGILDGSRVHFIQRRRGGEVFAAVNREADIA